MLIINRIYKVYYVLLVILAIVFGIALYQSYNEKEELKRVLFNGYATVINTSINNFIKVKENHDEITKQMVYEFMKDLEFSYTDFKIKFLFKKDINNLKKELKLLKYLEKDGYYKTFGVFDRTYYIAIKDDFIKKKYNSLFIDETKNIIGILEFFEDEDRMDNIGGNIEENFDGKKGLFLSVYLFLALIGYMLIRIMKNYFSIIEEKNRLEIEKEVAKKNEKLKSEFLANMSHEIRTPLNSMFGFIKLLEEKQIDEESKKYLKIIKHSGESLLKIINDILDFSKIQSNRLKLENKEFDLKDEIEMEFELFKNEAKDKNIKLHLRAKNIDFNVISDSLRLKQIISNLLSNAIKFTPEGKDIYFNIEYDNENEKLYVSIEDEGIGISKDKLTHIFKPFTQEDNSTTRKYGGAGLGLSISYDLVKLLGGKLEVESEEGKGSKFYFEIPLKKGTKTIKKTNKDKFDFNILVVEDNKANQMFIKVILNNLGIKFDIANDGIEAVELYKKNYKKYDLILMDENMPNMSGSEATKKIREFEKENDLENIFIIAFTANALSGDKEKFLEMGMDEYLSKPLDVEKFKDILRKIK